MNDEPTWLITVQRAFPDLRVFQLPDVLSTYNVRDASVSRTPVDDSESYIDWGLQYLSRESPRVLGDSPLYQSGERGRVSPLSSGIKGCGAIGFSIRPSRSVRP